MKAKAGSNIREISSKSRISGFTSTLLKALGKKTEKGEPNKISKSEKIGLLILTATAILAIAGFAVISTPVSAQPVQVWNLTWGGTGDDAGYATATGDSVYLAGYTNSFGAGGYDAFLVKYSETPQVNCTCGDICVNTTGWWRAGADFNASGTPIQHAIDSATAGETICVKDGNYNENVNVNVNNLTIRSENGSASTIVNASNPNDHVFDVTADWVNISGFTMKDATGWNYAGINLNNRKHCNISNNTMTNNSYGIRIWSSSNNTFMNNNITSNIGWAAFNAQIGCHYNRIINNVVSSNDDDGIYLGTDCLHNTIKDNYVSENHGFEGIGIFLDHNASYNTVVNNTAIANKQGILLNDECDYNNLSSNRAYNNTDKGIALICMFAGEKGNSNNALNNNTASNNTNYDFYSGNLSHNNTVTDLTICSYPTTISFTYDNGIGIKGVTTPPEPDPAGKVNISKYVNATNVTANTWLFLNVSYEDGDLGNVDEDTLRMWKYNGTWTEVPSPNGVNTVENYVYANITEFSVFAPLGNVTGAAPPNITSFAPPSPVNDTVCNWRTFNVTVNQTVNVSWYLNNSHLFTNDSITEANYTLHAEFVGDNNVSAVASNTNGTLMQTWIWNVVSAGVFDTGSSANPYPSISGTHNGTITPNQTITVSKLYTYSCSGTGGHSEHVRIWNDTWAGIEASWAGYLGDWHNVTFLESFTLVANETYNFTIKTGSYPQIHHTNALQTANGWINCTQFVDANGRSYTDWIPAIHICAR